MIAPSPFVVTETFRHRSPEYVRSVAQTNGFRCLTAQGLADSEIWEQPSGDGGHWLIRLDTMGHDTSRHFGARPHYHKNWVESDELLQRYLRGFTPQAWVYSDEGIPIGLAGGADPMHPDQKAKLQHIPR